jgi:lysophospholipase L1-like esterase
MVESGFLIGEGQTLVCLGDSITEAPDGYVSVIANLIAAIYPERRIRVINAGASGNRAPDMLARLETDVLAHDPGLVTVNVGINDVWHGFYDFDKDRPIRGGGGPNGIPLDRYEVAVKSIVDQIFDRSRAQIVLVTPTVIGEDPITPEIRLLEEYVSAMECIAAESGAYLCRLHNAFAETLSWGKHHDPTYSLTTDGVHMNPVGNHLIAVAILNCLHFFDRIQESRSPVSIG